MRQRPHLCFLHIHGGTASTPILKAHLWWDHIHTCASETFKVGQCPHLCFKIVHNRKASTPLLQEHLWWDFIQTYNYGTLNVGQCPHLCFMHTYMGGGGTASDSCPMLNLGHGTHLRIMYIYASCTFMVGQRQHLCFMHLYDGTASTSVLHAHLWWDSANTVLPANLWEENLFSCCAF